MNIATFGPDGNIHLVAMWYGFIDGPAGAFETFTKSQKIKNLQRAHPASRCWSRTADEYDHPRAWRSLAPPR